jgi:hypothetical protein
VTGSEPRRGAPGGGASVRAADARYLAIRAAVVHGVEAAASVTLARLKGCAAELVRALRGSTKGFVTWACGCVLCGEVGACWGVAKACTPM